MYLCLAKQAKALKANSLARQMLDKILVYQIPPKFQVSFLTGVAVPTVHWLINDRVQEIMGVFDKGFWRKLARFGGLLVE